jgi:hypothetical protein
MPQSAFSNTAVLAGDMTTFSGVKVSNQQVSLHIQWANSSEKKCVNNLQFVNANREFESIYKADMANKQQEEKIYYTQKHIA